MKVCIFGASSAKIDEKYITSVENLGEKLARRGHSLVFGAGAKGLMGAAARGFAKGGGEITGVIPTFFRDDGVEPIFEGCDKIIFTETMSERKATMEDLADAFVTVPGGVGTFEEFFEVLTLKQLGRHNKAMTLFNIFGYYDDLEHFMHTVTERKFITFACSELYKTFNDVDSTVFYLENYKPGITPWQKLKKSDYEEDDRCEFLK